MGEWVSVRLNKRAGESVIAPLNDEVDERMGKPTVLRTAPRLPYLPPPAAGNAAEAEPMPNGIPQGVLVRGIGGYWWVLVGIGMCSGVLAANVANVDAPKPTQEQHSRNRKNAKKGIGVGELNGIIILIDRPGPCAGVSSSGSGAAAL